jgi:branched-chain amino acid transport system substrate-binding protein
MKRFVRLAVVLLMAVVILLPLLFTPCNSQPAGEIVIGYLTDLTGFMAPPGIPGMKAAKTILNMNGYQVNGRRIKLVVEDSATEPAQAMDKVRKLIEVDKACMIIGPIYGGTHLAIAPYLDKVQVPSLTVEANWEKMALDNRWTWIVSGGLIQHNYPVGAYCYDTLGYRTVSLLYPEMSGGPDFYEGFKRGFTERGGKIVQEQWFPPGTKDFGPYILALQRAQADFVQTFAVGEHVFPLYGAVRQLGLKKPIVEAPGESANPAIIKANNGPEGLILGTSYLYTLDTPENRKFVAAYQKEWGELPAHVSGAAASAVQVALEALRKAGGDTSGKALAKALGQVDIDTIRGRITMTPDRVGTVPFVIGKVVKGAKGEFTYQILKRYVVACKKEGNKLTYSVK